MLAVLKQLLLSRDIKLTWMAIYKTWKPTGVICLAMKMQLDWQVYEVPALFVAADDGTINQDLVDEHRITMDTSSDRPILLN